VQDSESSGGIGCIERCGNHPGKSDSLSGAIKNWATPLSTNGKSGPRTAEARRRHRSGLPLQDQVSQFPTPAARDYRTPSATSYQDRSDTTKGEQLPNFIAHCSRLDPMTLSSGDTPSSAPQTTNQRLSPVFVEWLMGWPLHWTAVSNVCSVPATVWCQWLQDSRSTLRSLIAEIEA